MSLTGADVREIFEAVLPEAALREAMMAAQFQQRERKLDALQQASCFRWETDANWRGRPPFIAGGPRSRDDGRARLVLTGQRGPSRG